MKTSYIRVLYILLFALALIFLLLPFYRPHEIPVFLLLVGRVHPVILHFPIVLIILSLVFELAGKFGYIKKSNSLIKILLLSSVLTTCVVVGAGFFLFASGDYSGELMESHFWAGSVTGAAIAVTTALFFLFQETGRYYGAYIGGLILSAMVVGYASHLGGSITHGKDFLTAYVPAVLNNWKKTEDKPESEMMVYQDMILPVLEFKCASCHNATRAKGGYVVTPLQNTLKAGESGHPAITVNDTYKSELFTRITLPESHEDHMPPEGKTPMSENEIALVKFWIESGASDSLSVTEARTGSMAPVVSELLLALTNYHRKSVIAKMKTDALKKELEEIAVRLKILVRPDSLREGDLFSLAMNFPPSPLADDQIKALMPYGDHFSRISLVSTGISDDALYYIGQMTNVTELYLQKTGLNGSGLVFLQGLPNLEVLNLSFTNIDDKALIDLLKIPHLREVYLYRTKTSPAVIEALRKYRPDLKIAVEEGPYL